MPKSATQLLTCVVQDGFGTANTALIYHANKLLALHEGDLPYAVSTLKNHSATSLMPL